MREEEMHRILGHHNLYCTVCDRNNGDFPVHNATEHFEIEHQRYPFRPKPYDIDASHPLSPDVRTMPVVRVSLGGAVPNADRLAVEEPLEIRLL